MVFEDKAPHPIPADRLTHLTQLPTNKNAKVHYVQFFYGGLLFMCWRSHSVKPLLVAAAVYLPLYFIPVQRMGGWPFTGFMNRPFWRCVQRALQIKVGGQKGNAGKAV